MTHLILNMHLAWKTPVNMTPVNMNPTCSHLMAGLISLLSLTMKDLAYQVQMMMVMLILQVPTNTHLLEPLIVHNPQVLEPSHIVKVLPGIPLQVRHKGFRLCGDNIDKSIRRHHSRSDRRNQSLHYFHAYAVENRVDVSHLSDINIHISEITSIEYVPNSVLPRLGDDSKIKENIATLISRVLFRYLDFFQLSFDNIIEWHIQAKYYSEMSCKSEVVCTLIVLHHNTLSFIGSPWCHSSE